MRGHKRHFCYLARGSRGSELASALGAQACVLGNGGSVLRHDTSRFPYVLRPFTGVQFPTASFPRCRPAFLSLMYKASQHRSPRLVRKPEEGCHLYRSRVRHGDEDVEMNTLPSSISIPCLSPSQPPVRRKCRSACSFGVPSSRRDRSSEDAEDGLVRPSKRHGGDIW